MATNSAQCKVCGRVVFPQHLNSSGKCVLCAPVHEPAEASVDSKEKTK